MRLTSYSERILSNRGERFSVVMQSIYAPSGRAKNNNKTNGKN
jgi:hypothetical protein